MGGRVDKSGEETRQLLVGQRITEVILDVDDGQETNIVLENGAIIRIRNDEDYQPQSWIGDIILR